MDWFYHWYPIYAFAYLSNHQLALTYMTYNSDDTMRYDLHANHSLCIGWTMCTVTYSQLINLYAKTLCFVFTIENTVIWKMNVPKTNNCSKTSYIWNPQMWLSYITLFVLHLLLLDLNWMYVNSQYVPPPNSTTTLPEMISLVQISKRNDILRI